MEIFGDLEDPRKPCNGTRYDFREILVMTVAAVLSDYDTMEEVVAWSRTSESWLRKFIAIRNGIASADTFLCVFQLFDPKGFEACFRRWVSRILSPLAGTIAVNGKTIRGSGSGVEQAIHMLSAFATEIGLVFGQEKFAFKSNEITAISELLEALYLKGFMISMDPIGCQKAIAQQIIAKEADCLLSVKGNQHSLLRAIQTAFARLVPWPLRR